MKAAQLKRAESVPASLDTDARSSTYDEHDRGKRDQKARLIQLLFEAGCADAAKKVADCNKNYFALACGNRHCVQVLPTSRCRSRLCPYCARERQHRAFMKIRPRLRAVSKSGINSRPVLITLTFRHNLDSLERQDKEFKAAFKRLRRIRRWRETISGAFCGYEFTRTLSGWHYHAHILALRKVWYEQEDLTSDWQKATRGRGGIVDIRAITNSVEGLRKVLQYCLKPPDLAQWTGEDVRQFQSMSRVKLSECFGELRGLKFQEAEDHSQTAEPLFVGCPCPECGEPLQMVRISWRDLARFRPIQNAWLVNSRDGPTAQLKQ